VADLIGTFKKPFKEAIAAFRLRMTNLQPTKVWTDLWQEQHDRAFMVAGATKADLLADLAKAVEKAIAEGTSLGEFRRDFRKIIEERGWHGWTGEGTKGGEAWRTRVIYRTNMRVSYAAGRMAQLVEGGFPLWVYRHGGSVEPRIIHLGWDGLVLPPDHPFWATHAPPNGWGCSCYIVGARSFRGAQRLGGQPGKELPEGWQKLDPKTGAPVGIDKGWAYAPGRSVADDIRASVTGKADRLPEPIRGALDAALTKVVSEATSAGPLSWTAWPKTKTLAEIAEAAKASGVAATINLRRSLPVDGMRSYLRTAAEIIQRFNLPPLVHFSHADDLPFPVRDARNAAAFYVPAKQAMAVRPMGVVQSKVTAAFDVAAPAKRIEAWKIGLQTASAEVKKRARQIPEFRWTVIRDVRGVASHEFGHHLHNSALREIDELIDQNNMLADGWPLLISGYGRTNRKEFVAESFALYMSGQEDQFFRLHPALLEWFKRKEGKL